MSRTMHALVTVLCAGLVGLTWFGYSTDVVGLSGDASNLLAGVVGLVLLVGGSVTILVDERRRARRVGVAVGPGRPGSVGPHRGRVIVVDEPVDEPQRSARR